MHAYHVPHAKHMESCRSDEMAKHGRDDSASVKFSTSALESLYCNAVLSSAYPVYGSASEVNCSGADMQVISLALLSFHLSSLC